MLDEGICSTLDGKCSTPKWGSWCTWWHMQYTRCQMQYTQVRLLMYMMAYAVQLCGKYSIPSEAPDLHDRICSTLDGKCSAPKWGSWSTAWPLQYTWWLMLYIPVLVLMLDDGICSMLYGKCNTPEWGSLCTWWHMQYTCWQIQYTKWGSWFTW